MERDEYPHLGKNIAVNDAIGPHETLENENQRRVEHFITPFLLNLLNGKRP